MCRLRPLAALVFAAAATLGFSARALAQQGDKQQQLQQQVNESGAAEDAARAKVVDAQAQRQKFDNALADVTTRLAAANDRLVAAQATVDRLGAEAAALQVKLDATAKKLVAARDDVRHSAVLLYQHGDGTEMIGLLGSTDGSGDLVEGKHYLQRVSDKRQGDAKRVTRLKQQLDAQRDAVAQQKQQADAARAAAADEKAQLDNLAAQQASARDAADNALQVENAALGDAISQHDQAEAALAAESARIAELAQSAGDGPSLGDGTFIWPVSGPITSGFGYRTDPITGATAYHAGLDIGAGCGTPIKAAGTGVILSAGFNSGGYGNMTLINHGNGLSTLYGHQSSIIVSAGQSVTQGQVIGYVGSTGKSTGCHLHFEVRVNGNPVDPRGYL
ncbi:MAG TPA: M23 family metallopeptidase [Acidimicrobiia bacterium]|jgi:murein DD-endopeptidase MepM/ murein hydrolase activator NlpD|nr:M23 family metallopeptidase [Acidimicrobiia bacterium]